MICTDKLTEGIKRSSCPQDTLRGFTGSIIIQDWRGYNKYNPDNNYKDYVELEAEKYSIKPSIQSEKRDDDLVWFTHTVNFWIKNNSDEAINKLVGFTNVPLIVSLKKEDGNYLTFFQETGARLNISTSYHSGTNGFVAINCEHFHRNVKESLGGVRGYLNDVNYTVLDETSSPVEGAIISVDGNDFTTDVNGEATIKLLSGTYTYSVVNTGYETYTDTVIVEESPVDITVNLVLATNETTIGTTTYKTTNETWDDGGTGIYSIDDNTANDDEYGKIYTFEAVLRLLDANPGYRLMNRNDIQELQGLFGGTFSANAGTLSIFEDPTVNLFPNNSIGVNGEVDIYNIPGDDLLRYKSGEFGETTVRTPSTELNLTPSVPGGSVGNYWYVDDPYDSNGFIENILSAGEASGNLSIKSNVGGFFSDAFFENLYSHTRGTTMPVRLVKIT